MNIRIRAVVCAIFVLAVVAVSPAVFGATVTYTAGGGTEFWSNPLNWSGNSVPTSSDDVIIASAGTGSVSADVSPIVNSITVQNNASLFLDAGQVLTVNNSSTVDLGGDLFLGNNSIFSGNGDLTVYGTVRVVGGTLGGSGALTVNPSGVLWVFVATNASEVSRTTTNAGTIRYSFGFTGPNVIFSGATLTNTGTIDIQTDHDIDVGGGSPILNNNSGGVIKKSLGSGSATINFSVNNAAGGTIQAQSGTLGINGGGAVSGAYSISSGATLDFSGGTFGTSGSPTLAGSGTLSVSVSGTIEVNPGTFAMSGSPTVSCAGLIDFEGGMLDVGAGVNVTSNDAVLSSGSITGAGDLHVSGNFDWFGGTISGGGARVLDSTSTPTISCSTSTCLLDGATLQLQASATYSGSIHTLVFSNGASLIVDPGKTLNVTNDGSFQSGGGAASSIINNGTIWKKTTSGTSAVGVPLTLSGTSTVQIDTGTLQFGGGAGIASGATLDIAAGRTLEVTGGVSQFNSGAVSLPGSGTFNVSAGTLRVPTGITMTIPKVTLQGSGIIDGGGTLILTGASTWVGGTMGSAAAPGGITQINPGNTLTIGGAAPKSLTQARQLLNNGTVSYTSAGNFVLTMSGNSKITNNSTFNLPANDGVDVSGSALIENYGTLAKTGGAASSILSPRVENNAGGTVSVTTGTLELQGGGIAGGAYAISSGATLSLAGGTFTVASTATVTGAGTLSMGGATLDAGSGVDLTCPNLALSGGTITGAGALRVSGNFTWSSGTITGSGPRVLNSTSTPTISCASSNCFLDGAALELQASATFSASSNPLVFSNGASLTIDSGKTLSITNDGNFAIGGGAASTIINNGALTKNGGTGTSALFPAVNNAGTVSATTGTLALAGGGTNTGSFTVTTPGILSFSSGTQSMSGGGSISGTGMLRFSGATATVGVPINVGTLNVTAGTAALNANGAADAFTMGGGTLGGSGTLTLNNGGTWSGGTMSGSGTTTNPAAMTFSIPGSVTLNGRTIQNNGTLDVSGGVIGGTGTINNIGAINDTDGATINAPMNNSGQVSTSWLLSLGGNGTHSGTFTATSPTSVIDFSGGAQTISGTFAGAGKFRFSGAAATVNGAWSGKTIDVAGGSVALNTSGTLPALTLSGGTLAGSGGLTVTGASTWSGGTIGGSGALTFDTGATVTMPGTSAATLSRPLLNNGTINFTAASSAMLIDGVAITNSGTFDIQSSQSILVTPGTPPFINNGTLRKSSGAGVTQFAAPLANTGTVQVGAGTLNFSGTYTQTAGTTSVLPGATLQTTSLSLNGGSLIGNGTIAGTVANHAVVAPGASPGTLTISGDYVQASNGVLDIQIGGTAPGSQYDRLLVSGNVALDGTLNVIPISGFVPAAGNAFQILTFGARPGSTTFATINGLDYGSGTALVPTYSASDLQLITNSVQADIAALVSAPPSAANGSAFAYTVSITNRGGSDATAVSFSAALPPNVTFNGASGAICSGAPNLLCTIGALPNQSAAVVVLDVTANGAGAAPIIVSTAGSEFDPNGANNTASASTSITAAADLRIAVTGTPATVPGSRAVYTITVTNSGPDLAGNVAVSVAASPGLTFSANGGACTGSFPCTIGALSSGQSATINSAWNISSAAAGSVQLTVNATSSAADPNSSNNSASAMTLIGTCPAIVINAPSELISGASAQATAAPTAALSGGATYNWSISNGTIDSGNGTDTISFTAGTAGTATIAVNVTGTSCTLSTTALLTVKPRQTCQGTATPVVPAGGTITADAVVAFSWTAIDDASGYRLWLQDGDAPPQSLGRSLDTSLTKAIPPGAHHWYVETLFDGCASHQSEHLALTILPAQDCGTHGAPQLTAPASDTAATSATVAFSWDAVAKAIGYELWLAPAGGVPTLIRATSDRSYTAAVPLGSSEWYVRAIFDGCAATESAHRTFTYTLPPECTSQRPLLIAPAEGERLTSPVSFEWRAVPGATTYEVYVDGLLAAKTTSPRAPGIAVPLDERRWRVRALLGEACGALDSAESRFAVIAPAPSCTPLEPPLLTAPGQISSGVTARIQWTFVAGATAYVVQISNDPLFPPASTISSTVTTRELPFTFTNESNVPVGRYVRVFAIDTECVSTGSGPFSPVAVVSVLPRTGTAGAASLSDPTDVEYTLTIAANFAGMNFTATPTAPWITVTPSSGIVPPGGQTLHAVAHTAGLPAGASTGTVLVTTTAAAGTRAALGNPPPVSLPITVSNIPGVTTKPKSTPPPDSLTIPAVANVKNFIVRYQSDVCVTNTSAQVIKYEINFVPTGLPGITQGQTTNVSIEPGATLALNDIVTTWFGGLTSSGTLEIRPLTESDTSTSSAPATGLANRITFASSRTFAVASSGATYGQYIPAVPYANFISKGAVISLQQIAQSDKFRTNLGLVEGSGEPVSVQVRIFDSAGTKRGDFNVDLNGGQHTQINEVLKAHGIALDDGRIEVEVTKGDGKVTAYASVIDDETNDPLLVPPVTIADAGNSKWVVPGVADLTGGSSNWQTDVRIFNAGKDPVDLTLVFYSRSGGTATSRTITLAAGEVRQLDRVLSSFFGISQDGGALHVSSSVPARLVVTARTYNDTGQGTYGQFIPAVTPEEAVSAGSRPLQILQVEESAQYRSNVGFAEVSGNAVTLEVSVFQPNQKDPALLEVKLGPNEFRQIDSLLSTLGLADTFNARISVRAVSGEGRATAYLSLIDAKSGDPTYVPGQ